MDFLHQLISEFVPTTVIQAKLLSLFSAFHVQDFLNYASEYLRLQISFPVGFVSLPTLVVLDFVLSPLLESRSIRNRHWHFKQKNEAGGAIWLRNN
jgi:hypothetical protein